MSTQCKSCSVSKASAENEKQETLKKFHQNINVHKSKEQLTRMIKIVFLYMLKFFRCQTTVKRILINKTASEYHTQKY